MKLGTIPYRCVGYCIIDSRGHCVACGRPPDLGALEAHAKAIAGRNAPLPAPEVDEQALVPFRKR